LKLTLESLDDDDEERSRDRGLDLSMGEETEGEREEEEEDGEGEEKKSSEEEVKNFCSNCFCFCETLSTSFKTIFFCPPEAEFRFGDEERRGEGDEETSKKSSMRGFDFVPSFFISFPSPPFNGEEEKEGEEEDDEERRGEEVEGIETGEVVAVFFSSLGEGEGEGRVEALG